jgi:Ca2+-binding EF-hand superfamily protein
MATLTKEQATRAMKEFHSYDTNQDGTLSVKEFTKALRPFLAEEDLATLLKEMNPDGDDKISYAEFLAAYKHDL